MPATLACARAGVTTGEWAGALREVFGEYRAPTGVVAARSAARRRARRWPRCGRAVARDRRGARRAGCGMLVGKPGLDGHSNGAEQIAVRARDAGFEVVYQGIRLTPAQIVAAAVEEDVARRRAVDPVRLAPRRSSPTVLRRAARGGHRATCPVVVGGIIPDADAALLRAAGVAAVFTPKDYDATAVMMGVLDAVRVARGLPPLATAAAG